MNFESTLETIAKIEDTIETVQRLPRELTDVLHHAASYFPTDIDLGSALQFMLYFTLTTLVLGVLGRLMLGKRSSLNHSLSSIMGILFVYVVTVVVYTFRPWQLYNLLSPLPLVTFTGDFLIVYPIANTHLTALCTELLSLIILAFLVNLTDTFLPQGSNPVVWFFWRFVSVGGSIVLHYFARQALHYYLPDVLVNYAPTILLFLLAFMLLGGVINLILGIIIAVANPFLGAMYTFFFSNVVGKQLTKAVFSGAIICGIIYVLEYFGYTVIYISAAALMAYIPFVILLLLLWYIIGRVL